MESILVIPSIGNNVALRRTLESVRNSDYNGDIVVPYSSPKSLPIIEEYGVALEVDGIHSTDYMIWKGATANKKKYDLLIYTHSDVVLTTNWYGNLMAAWGSVDKDLVGTICLPYYIHNPYIRGGEYFHDINNITFEELSMKWDKIRIDMLTTVNRSDQLVGLGYDFFNVNPSIGREYCGRTTPCTSYLFDDYLDVINTYGDDTNFNSELLLIYQYLHKHKMLVWVNCEPIFHALGQDSDDTTGLVFKHIDDSYKKWFDIFGYNGDHFISIVFGLIQKKYMSELIDYVNDGNKEAIGRICDECIEMLNLMECDDCPMNKACRVSGRKYEYI